MASLFSLSSVFGYLPLILALYSAWSSGGYTPLLQFALTIAVGRMLNTALSTQLNLMFAGATPMVVLYISLIPAAIAVGGYLCGCSMRMLATYGFTSFLFPAVRRRFPTAGPPAVAASIVAAIACAWQEYGISPFLVFIIFLQALPEIQRPLWIGGPTKSRLHLSLVVVVSLLASPFAVLGGFALAKPELLTNLTDTQLRALCFASNGCPSIDHRDLYDALGLRKYASPADVRKAYRRISLENHPDKLVDTALTPEEKQERVDAFTRAASAYEVLSKPGAQGQYDAMVRGEQGVRPELLDLAPRCVVVAIMLIYWLALSASQLRESGKQKNLVSERLRRHIMNKGPINLPAIGLTSREPLENFARFHELPVVMNNNENELAELRRLLLGAGVELNAPDLTVEQTIVRSTRGDPDGLRAHILNGGALDMEAIGVERSVLEKYARDVSNPMMGITKNGNEDVLRMRALLENAGIVVSPMPEGERTVVVITA
jgi:hypothetical protein